MSSSNSTGASPPPPEPRTALDYWQQIGDALREADTANRNARDLMQRWFVAVPIEQWNRRA